ncbi:MAG: bifunctional demethylmenaquinone methyltransferase/2-methoxy-6-polyprenyl-1,4-benzoquinol methylase UbiE [Helicobacteraceae bacterium]|jgi:demethylmenaquinone methyltransferase/2-methoxy-6-polyprenyl-1,4-benzoquinol methylase|nr:bifunctional demethylmenaquinone methyltransferase/2-methoxy-6-polyprenyl-1,4-benzoquinol methylase UbiE [Helicobacteraceae bacterium]
MTRTDKQQEIVEMFDHISSTYDRLNRILSFGVDRSWRRKGCLEAFKIFGKPCGTLLDVASGTGDLMLFWRKASCRLNLPIDRAICIDPSAKMLDIARKKVKDAEFLQHRATDIPLENAAADLISISYGIRNVIEIDRAIGEFYRLLRPGGVLLILEFMNHKKQTLSDRAVSLYLFKILPAIGRLFSRDRRAYAYLPASIERFLTAEELCEKLKKNGFEIAQVKDETFGVSTRFIARKPL